ncbi:hypothetical protein [Bacillus alkalicellulosilyticus]|uniref:hypothetical protein n=1 Tax=Alkalihalobacterium alkalicellulosilyticum TaxID=1912214 RepID=UPI000996FBB1|nr:hypothetical protein [Bacillus alkalicellulosilyticus]
MASTAKINYSGNSDVTVYVDMSAFSYTLLSMMYVGGIISEEEFEKLTKMLNDFLANDPIRQNLLKEKEMKVGDEETDFAPISMPTKDSDAQPSDKSSAEPQKRKIVKPRPKYRTPVFSFNKAN